EAATSAANENRRCMPYLLLEYGLPLSMHYGRQPATVSHACACRAGYLSRSTCAPCASVLSLGDAATRATKLRRLQRTALSGYGLSKPQRRLRTSFRRYRTQEVAGSSPASSIRTLPGQWRP